ncbi:hypothetical protein Taro_030862 [Colocasia esculenta]|uniref:RRM domain-containing protein n=1 Tax=Colocasia esculenta TaxID=4460 RepID=A0A843W1F8_COLES|nr:hypothetical protein [Colocasia esculenta]
MRTPKSGGTKKTPPSKKDAAAAAAPAAAAASEEKTPETPAAATAKAAPKSGPGKRAAKGAGRQSTPRSTAAASAAPAPAPAATPIASPVVSTPPPDAVAPATPASSDPKVEQHVVEETTSSPADTKGASIAKPSEKKVAAKTKSPLTSSTEAAVIKEPTEEPEEAKNQLGPKSDDPGADADPVKSDALGKPSVRKRGEEENKPVTLNTEGKVQKQDAPENEAVQSGIKKEVESTSVLGTESGVDEPFMKKEGEPSQKAMAMEGEGRVMEEHGEQEDFETGNEDMMGEEREDEEGVDEEEAGLKEEEQIEMSDIIKERKKKKEQEIFVGGLDRDATEEDVKKVFDKFANKEQASKAISELKNPIIKRRLKEYGVEGLENITLVEDTQNEGLSRGFAFVEFSCHEYAMNAYKRLQRPDVVFGHAEWSAKVAFAEPLREPDAEVMAQVKSVFVDGMPPYWDEDRVKEHFKGYGEIERVVLARNMPTAKRKDFGFVNFTTHEAAVACAEAANNTELGDGKSKMKARARLANPLPKTQAVKGGIRGGFRIGHTGVGFFPRFGKLIEREEDLVEGGFLLLVQVLMVLGGFIFVDVVEVEDFLSRSTLKAPVLTSVVGGLLEFEGDYEDHSGALMREWVMNFRQGLTLADSYYYGDMGHGMKRPYSMMEHDSSYLEPGSRVRPRYDFPDPLSGGAHYRDPTGTAGGLYSHDYYGSDYEGSGYSSLYRGEGSGGGYYY